MALIKPEEIKEAKSSKRLEKKQTRSLTPKQLERKGEAILEYPIPIVFNEFQEEKRAIPHKDLYLKLQRLTPYLVKRLIFESYHPENPPSVRVKAAQVLLDKIIPNLSAEELNVNSEDLQALVIVKNKPIKQTDP